MRYHCGMLPAPQPSCRSIASPGSQHHCHFCPRLCRGYMNDKPPSAHPTPIPNGKPTTSSLGHTSGSHFYACFSGAHCMRPVHSRCAPAPSHFYEEHAAANGYCIRRSCSTWHVTRPLLRFDFPSFSPEHGCVCPPPMQNGMH